MGGRAVGKMHRGLNPVGVLTNLQEGTKGKMSDADTVVGIVNLSRIIWHLCNVRNK